MSDSTLIDTSVYIYGIVEGPIHSSDIPNWDDDKEGWMILAQVEQSNGAIMCEEITFDTFDEAYEVIKYFKEFRPLPYVLNDLEVDMEEFD